MLALLPTVQSVVDAQRRAILHDNLKQLAFAMHAYHDKHRTRPPHAVFDKAGRPLLSWRVLILPYLGQEDLYQPVQVRGAVVPPPAGREVRGAAEPGRRLRRLAVGGYPTRVPLATALSR